jgi:hypothetical protein
MAPARDARYVLRVPLPRRYTMHCPSGHEYTTENSYVNPSTGNRQCRACQAERSRQTFRRKLYGLQIEEYEELLDRQRGRCAICREPAAGDLALAADHDHATGAIRGLLCSRCNNGLGSFRDDPGLLEAAVRYLNAEPAFVPAVLPPLVGQRCACGAWAARFKPNATADKTPVCLTCFSRAVGRTGKGSRGRPRLS